ncbi:hypothetical protein ET495_17345 (plasmid) [Xylanimonas allomyrinae]|uniref:Uncharacterized protein n=1 Tax=Xylanimonas allomyrinae TaxID=2509459 RepID=A0A4P6EQZ3_9MICO|nr:hypothetical protein [Xylanimonas allomyrinae]QAY64986.1 hypothetical protein ET495_17345 [Xylanimonas allomyrinae]
MRGTSAGGPMSGPDLFDMLAADEMSDVVHMILPNFTTACGLDFLDVSRAGQIKGTRLYTLTSSQTTCPGCLARGDLSALCQRISANQAPVQN